MVQPDDGATAGGQRYATELNQASPTATPSVAATIAMPRLSAQSAAVARFSAREQAEWPAARAPT